ncbi:MAG: DUF6456 domain-containing protein [Roseovarius sp.]|uniref:DUF6456 domain-containing protein n=1 Tax=Roseobacteraceae TaxID=2854170 RepID=UPI0032EC83DB
MSHVSPSADIAEQLPCWVPKEALAYLLHTETGQPIRALAREAGVHASTVLRQVRALEARREDILVDQGLSRLGRRVVAAEARALDADPNVPSMDELSQEARRVLRLLCEPGAVLAVAAEMDKAVVVAETEEGGTARRLVVDHASAEAMALAGWIACEDPGRVSRYRITAAGRDALKRMVADAENRAFGFSEAPARFDHVGIAKREEVSRAHAEMRSRCQAAETPLTLLSRRRDRSGRKFLSDDLVRAGERLREDYEMADIGCRSDESWDRFLTKAEAARSDHGGATAARSRVLGALRDLGPGLGDVALRCCCHLEGLESAERKMGWSARSGKVVLRIALQRLRRHYDRLGDGGALMG